MNKIGGFLLAFILAPAVLAQETPALSAYAAKVAYREYLRQNNLNPSDEEITEQITLIKDNPERALSNLYENVPTPKTMPETDLGAEIAKLQHQKPKRIGNHPLYIDPSLF